jgi:hypothetical protein
LARSSRCQAGCCRLTPFTHNDLMERCSFY